LIGEIENRTPLPLALAPVRGGEGTGSWRRSGFPTLTGE
jgi:hypothetical protein